MGEAVVSVTHFVAQNGHFLSHNQAIGTVDSLVRSCKPEGKFRCYQSNRRLVIRQIGAAFLAAGLIASTVVASAAPLPAGKPAGVQNAAIAGQMDAVLFGTVIIITGLVLTVTGNEDKGVTTPTTTSTGTSGLP